MPTSAPSTRRGSDRWELSRHSAAKKLRKWLPDSWVFRLTRWKKVLFQMYIYRLSRRKPQQLRKFLLGGVRKALGPDYDVATHFTPDYNPWDQRLCAVPDGDLFAAIRAGDAEVVTDHIDQFNGEGIQLKSGKQLNADYSSANQALRKVKKQQIATIAISALKFTIENAPGRQGGKLGDLAVEGVKKLNGFLMDKYVGQPIVGFSEVDLLKGNFVKIKDGEKLMAHLDKSRRRVLDLAHVMDDKAKALASAVTAEKAWKEFAWLCKAGGHKIKVTVIDYRSRDLELSLGGVKIGPKSKGQTFTIESNAILTARVMGQRRKFCLERREYAKRTKSIIIHPGPGGGPQDSLVYSSSRIPAKSAWKIKTEKFSWKPSFNSKMESAPLTVSGAYWKLEKDRMRWKIKAKPGEQVNFKVDGKIKWRFESNIRGRRKNKDEENDGTATLVLKVLK